MADIGKDFTSGASGFLAKNASAIFFIKNAAAWRVFLICLFFNYISTKMDYKHFVMKC